MKNLIFTLFCFLPLSSLVAQDLSLDYQYSFAKQEHSVVNIPEDTSHLQWGIWLKTSDPEFSFHTMKLFLNKDQSLYLDQFQGIAEIILGDNQRIPITVYWFENASSQYEQYDRVLAFQFNQDESNLLLKHEIKKIVFYTSYGKFTAKFENKEMVKKALYTLKYNVDIFNEVNAATLTGNFD